jgi:NAD+ synthase (glutamine-hydrolysing)
VAHSWECLAELIRGGHTDGIVCDIGMPVIHRGVRYNCRVFVLDRRVLLIRPKLYLANDGNYREPRYFAAWRHRRITQPHSLPRVIRDIEGQRDCPFGDAALKFEDAVLASETCEELFTPASPHIDLALSGVEIVTNGSGSHHQLRKLGQRLDLLLGATAKAGGVYLYANQQGCDGGRLYYDGCACVAVNGRLVAQGSQFSVKEVEVVTATVDLDEVVSHRGSVASLQEQAAMAPSMPLVEVDFALCHGYHDGIRDEGDAKGGAATTKKYADGEKDHRTKPGIRLPSPPITPTILAPEEEIARGPACWLWDYLRRSGASGFLLPLSGGADSSSVAAIVGCMCQMVFKAAVVDGDASVLADVKRLGSGPKGELPWTPEELALRLLTTVYMGTENSSENTRQRATKLASEVGSYHLDVKIDLVVTAMTRLFASIMGKTPRFRVHGGSQPENLALQNIQARLRMVLAFMLAQLTPWARGHGGFLLVLGSSNVDETLRGYLTKYDCSAADVNPIGGVGKEDLRRFLRWAAESLGYASLADVEAAPPTAELEPLGEGGAVLQTDEADMGMTYAELSMFGRLRKVARCGPVSMFRSLMVTWRDVHSPAVIAEKVKHFFRSYAANRHKATVLPPSYHAENYSPDDNRFDHRQFLYNISWPWQFKAMSRMVEQLTGQASEGKDV